MVESSRRIKYAVFVAGPTGFFQPKPILTLEEARQESKLCMMGAVRETLAKTGLIYFLCAGVEPCDTGMQKAKTS